jgi:hypothetical protein
VRGTRKQTSFDDFIACAEWLVARARDAAQAARDLAAAATAACWSRPACCSARTCSARSWLRGAGHRHAALPQIHLRRVLGVGLRRSRQGSGLPRAPRLFAVAQRRGGRPLSAAAGDDRRPRRSRRAGARLQSSSRPCGRLRIRRTASCCASTGAPATASASPPT